jgi:hypothetical protein
MATNVTVSSGGNPSVITVSQDGNTIAVSSGVSTAVVSIPQIQNNVSVSAFAASGPAGSQGPQGEQGPQGAQGPQGEQGPAGQGVPSGGDQYQALIKSSDSDYDTNWANIAVTQRVKNVSGGQLQKGTPVHAVTEASPQGQLAYVIAARADTASSMPATFILNETLNDEAEGQAIIVGLIKNIDTSSFTAGDVVYVGETGGYTNTKPTGTNLIQNLGVVIKSDSTSGSGMVYGSGRSNDIPNLPDGKIFIGSSANTTESAYTFPSSDGTNGQALVTDGNGVLSFGSVDDETFTQDYVANMPTVAGLVKTFGKYKNGDTIPADGKTATELLVDAFTDAVNPSPSFSLSGPDWQHPSIASSVGISSINFGIANQGATGTAVLEYQLSNSQSTPTGSWTTVQSYTSSEVTFGASNLQTSYDTGEAWASNNVFHFRLRVTDSTSGTTEQTANEFTTANSFNSPLISDKQITRSNSTISAATNTTSTTREYGDVQSTLRYDVRRDELYDPLIDSVIQFEVGSNYREITTPNSTTSLASLGNGSTQNNISLAINTDSITVATDGSTDLTAEATPHKYRIVVDSTHGSDTSGDFSDINYYYSYQVCFDTTALTTGSSQSAVQTVYAAFGGDDNGNNEREIKTGSYPESILDTNTYTVQTSNKFMYIFYPGTDTIETMTLDGVSPTIGAFTNLGTFTLSNRYGVSSTYRVYKSNSTNAFNNNFLNIS